MTFDDAVAFESLDRSWGEFMRILRHVPRRPPDENASKSLADRLNRFGAHHPPDRFHIEASLDSICRAVPLLLAAAKWRNPIAGKCTTEFESATSADRARGEQWRLVMAYGGFETLVKVVFNGSKRGGLGPNDFRKLQDRCDLPSFPSLAPPEPAMLVGETWFQRDSTGAASKLRRFLGISGYDAKMMEGWLLGDNTISTWPDAISLAKAFRNATAHGALSASKILEWKLASSIDLLRTSLTFVSSSILRELSI